MRFTIFHPLVLGLLGVALLRSYQTAAITTPSILDTSLSPNSGVHLYRRHGDHGRSTKDEAHDHDHEEGHEKDDSSDSNSSKCGTIESLSEYDLPLHIATIFILMLVSGIGCGITACANKSKYLRIPEVVVDVGRHFGSGVIISTAFIHMLMAAITNLTSECVPDVFKNYISFAPMIAMFAALAMHLIEFLALSSIKKSASSNSEESISSELGEGLASEKPESIQEVGLSHDHSHSHSNLFLMTERKVSTYILELGILSHSIFIGLSLGVTTGPEYNALLIAIAFHQFFEGIGLGARISSLQFESLYKPLMMVFMFSITTPVGITIGIGIRYSYASTSTASLVVQGIFDSISAGILIYVGLVELVGKELSFNSEFGSKPLSIKALYLFALYLGAAAMAVIGIWA